MWYIFTTRSGINNKKQKIRMISFEKSIGAVVFRWQGDTTLFLLLHYRPSSRPNGHWDFPKGHREKKEAEDETLRREVFEETGIADLKIIPHFRAQVSYFYRAGKHEKEEREKQGKNVNIMKKVAYYLAETKNKNVKISIEHTGYEWLGYGDALSRITYQKSKNVLKKADKYLKENTTKL